MSKCFSVEFFQIRGRFSCLNSVYKYDYHVLDQVFFAFIVLFLVYKFFRHLQKSQHSTLLFVLIVLCFLSENNCLILFSIFFFRISDIQDLTFNFSWTKLFTEFCQFTFLTLKNYLRRFFLWQTDYNIIVISSTSLLVTLFNCLSTVWISDFLFHSSYAILIYPSISCMNTCLHFQYSTDMQCSSI